MQACIVAGTCCAQREGTCCAQRLAASSKTVYHMCTTCLQAEQAIKHLQLEQQKAGQDQVKWETQQAELHQRLDDTLHESQRLQDAKASIEHEHSNLQELHKQLMTELQQRTGRLPQVWFLTLSRQSFWYQRALLSPLCHDKSGELDGIELSQPD